MTFTVPFILASASPRRRHLLEVTGLHPVVLPADIDETLIEGESPSDMTCRLGLEKAQSVADMNPEALVLGSDTTVVLDDSVLGKPQSRSEAIDMLSSLSGRSHTVISSVALIHGQSGRAHVEASTTTVRFDTLQPDLIERYVDGGSPMDKAGAYGIQDDMGAFFVKAVDGDYYTVVGLPLNMLFNMLNTHFPDLFSL